MNASPLFISLTFDLDPDHFDSSTSLKYRENNPTWNGIEIGIPLILDAIKGFKDSDGSLIKPSWFIRADNQIADLFDSPASLFSIYSELFKSLAEKGHELAWHPHLSHKVNSEWIQDFNQEKIIAQLKESYEDILSNDFELKTARIGGNFFSSAIHKTLENLGIHYDSSAMPGRKRDDIDRKFNWECTMQLPYYPSIDDYRVPSMSNNSLLELPLSMIPIKTSYDKESYLRYVDLTFHHKIMRASLKNYISQQPYLITVSHPGVLTYKSSQKPHGLLNYSIENFYKNIKYIVDYCMFINRPFYFVTMSDIGLLASKQLNEIND